MTRWLASLLHERPGRTVALAASALAAALVLTVPGAIAHDQAVPAPPANPTSADEIQNVDQVKTAIKAYYGDTVTTTADPVDGATMLHTYSPTGAYVEEMGDVEANAERYLDRTARHFHDGHGKGHGGSSAIPAIVLDIDDTTLNTYSYEIYSNFVFNPTTNGDFVNAAVFPPVPGMPDLVKDAVADGYQVFFLTGRPVTQTAGTVTNLTNAGYPTPDSSHLFLKDLSAPWLASCATTTPACSTTQYKSLTRQHIESLGYDIVANFGDQFSDLNGGFEDQAFKIPNPMYFLP